MPLVSVIVPVYNTENGLFLACVKSLDAQTYNNIEIILINDCSTNSKTNLLFKRIKSKNHSIYKYTLKNNMGVSYSRNYGISKSKGKYILFVDADDQISNNYIEKLVNKAEREHLEIVFPRTINIYKSNRKKENSFHSYSELKSPTTIINKTWMYSCRGVLFNSSIIAGVAFQPLKYGEDILFTVQVLNDNVGYENDAKYLYIENNKSVMNTIDISKAEKYISDNLTLFSFLGSRYPEYTNEINYEIFKKLNSIGLFLINSKVKRADYVTNMRRLKFKLANLTISDKKRYKSTIDKRFLIQLAIKDKWNCHYIFTLIKKMLKQII